MPIETYGYDDGLLSNSMLQAAITCPFKYKRLYLDKQKSDTMDGVWYDDTAAGSIVHQCLEKYSDESSDILLGEMWNIVEELFGAELANSTRSFMGLYMDARRATNEYGMQWGRVYTAPEMTSYWKKHYANLDRLITNLNYKAAEFVDGAIFKIPYFTLVLKSYISLENWLKMPKGEQLAAEHVTMADVCFAPVLDPPLLVRHMVGTIDRIESRPNGAVAICDYKTGKWGYDWEKLANSDQFYLYDYLLRAEGRHVTEWVLYDLFTDKKVTVTPTPEILEAGHLRLTNNLQYAAQIEKAFENGIVPYPAGSAYKLGCPCILAETGECPAYVKAV